MTNDLKNNRFGHFKLFIVVYTLTKIIGLYPFDLILTYIEFCKNL